MPLEVQARIELGAHHYGVTAHALAVAILGQWINRHAPYKSARRNRKGLGRRLGAASHGPTETPTD